MFFTVDHGTYHRKSRGRDSAAVEPLCKSLATWAAEMSGKCFKSNDTCSCIPKRLVHCYVILVERQQIPTSGVRRSPDGHAFNFQMVRLPGHTGKNPSNPYKSS